MKEKEKQFILSLKAMKAVANSSFFGPLSEYLNGILLQSVMHFSAIINFWSSFQLINKVY